MYLIRLYIGADNETHRVDEAYLDTIRRWADWVFGSYTLIRGEGHWVDNARPVTEDCVVIEVVSTKQISDVYKAVEAFRQDLGQESILVVQYAVVVWGAEATANV